MHRITACCLSLFSILLACSSTQTPPTDAGSDEAAPECNALAIPASITITAKSGTPPAPAGGTIADGTYVLTEMDDYNSGDAFVGAPTAGILVVSGATLELARVGAKGDVSRYGATFTTSSTTIVETGTCGLAAPVSEGFTATPTSITFVDTAPTFVSVYTRM
jgi:hypothetical protein